ncbi:MAG: amidohydrolase family protein [Nanoarchaeota archaeon]
MIDAHIHMGSISYKGKNWGKFEEYKKIAKKLGIERYCVIPIGLPENFVDNSTPNNDSVLREGDKDKSIIPIYWFNVLDLPKEIDKRYRAIKFHPDIGKVNIDDKRVIKFVNKINLPVFVHTNESKDFSNLGKVANLAGNVNVPVIAVHSGSVTSTFFKLDNYKFPNNVYFETSGIQYSIILQKIYEKFGAERIIFGSDYPFGDPRVSLAMIETLGISKKEYELITKKNISKILKL